MANEINMQVCLSIQRANLNVAGMANELISPAGTRASQNQITVTTGAFSTNAITLIDGSTSAGYLFVKNTDPTNFVQLALDSAGAKIFAKLRKLECCLVPLVDSTTQIYAQANTASVSIIVVAAPA